MRCEVVKGYLAFVIQMVVRRGKMVRVLVVDGNAQSRSLTASKLEDQGFDVSLVSSEEDALRSMESSDVDCVVSEYSFPGGNALDLCKSIYGRFGETSLILFTSYKDAGIIQDAFDCGFDEYVSKDLGDIRFTVLEERINQLIDKKAESRYSLSDLSEFELDDAELLSKIVNILPMGLLVRDADKRIVMANKAVLEQYNTSLDDVKGMTLEDSDMTEEEKEIVRRTDEEALEKWRPVETEEEFTTDNGAKYYVETVKVPFNIEDGNNPYLLSAIRDVTGSKRREKALEKVIEATEDLYQASTKREVWDIAACLMRDVFNLPMAASFSYNSDKHNFEPVETCGDLKEVFDEVPALDKKGSLAGDVFEEGEARFIDYVDHDKAYNPDTPIKSEIIVPVRDHGVIIAGSTERKSFDKSDVYIAQWFGSSVETAIERIGREKELDIRGEQLERQTKQINQFVTMLSHDLRNPLNVADGYLDMAEESGDGENFEKVRDALERMEEIVESMLKLAKDAKELKKQEFEIGEVAEEAWNYEYLSSAQLVNNLDLKVRANRNQILHLFENLYSNAIEHSGQELTVEVGPMEGGFYIEDNGPGIPESERTKIFDFGYTGTEGAGMGLAIVKKITAFQDWSIEVEESSDGGTRFEITF